MPNRHMKVWRAVLFGGGIACSFGSLGCWLLLQLGGVPRSQGPTTAFVMFACAAGFLVSVTGAVYVGERQNGVRAASQRVLFATGVCGIPVLLFFVAVSRGAILRIPEIDLLLFCLICLVAFFRRRKQPDSPKL